MRDARIPSSALRQPPVPDPLTLVDGTRPRIMNQIIEGRLKARYDAI
jgi:hypothetical protein